jgi:acetoin:2,6-dichlorophenolindophenol oxidoreductase subunit alpha
LSDRDSLSALAGTGPDVPRAALKKMYVTMLRIRKFEERVAKLVSRKEIVCPCHLYIGQEAVAAGVCASLTKNDWVFSTHRSHGHYIAKGGSLKGLMAELYGRATGCSGGYGGSMHLAAPEIGLPGSSAIVAGTVPLAAGAALAFQLQKKDSVAVAFFGDGAVDEGVWYETLNFASLKKLPVVFVCENNLYSTHMSLNDCLADTNIYKKAAAFNMPGVRIDGNDVVEVHAAGWRAVADARRGMGPTLIECMTYRWLGHVGSSDDLDKGLRSRAELDEWLARDPIKTYEDFLLEQRIISRPEKDRIAKEIDVEIEAAYTFAKESPYPDTLQAAGKVFK